MELGRLLVNGESYDPNKSYDRGDLSGNTPFVAVSAVTSPYENISSIENWNAYGDRTGADYKKYRDAIRDIVKNEYGDGSVEQGFTALTSTQKEIAAKNKIGTHDQRLNTLGFDNMVLTGLDYHNKVSQVREVRMVYATTYVWNSLGIDEATEIMDDVIVSGNNMFITYTFFGREGTAEGDREGITDYFYGRSGTTFENKGMVDKDFEPDGFADMKELTDKVYDVLINGNY